MFIINSGGNREFRYVSLAMIHHCMDIRRKYRLCIVIYRNCRICPPKESLRHRSPVVKLSTDFNIGLVRIKRKGCNSLCSVHLVHIIDHNSFASVLVLRNCIIYREICSRSVMLRPVKLNTAGDPGSGESHQSRFDHMIVVYKIIIICFVIGS